MAFVVDGRDLAEKRLGQLRQKVVQLKDEKITPQLVSLVVKDDSAGQIYTRLKKEAAEKIGVNFVAENIDKFSYDNLSQLIKKYNQDDQTHGMIIQRPGGAWRQSHQLSRSEFEALWQRLVEEIDPQKDVDGLRTDSQFTMATVKGVLSLIDQFGKGKRSVVVVGSLGLVGRNLIKELTKTSAFVVTGVDVDTTNLSEETIKGEILVSATGETDLIRADMIKKGAIVIDVGWPKGDVDFAEVKQKAAVITPVPGGVGPLTVVFLLENLVSQVYSTQYHSHSGSSLDN
jgi:methylenetetrahydrofolate dehydrogenase (NADP+)/methenyltetrahydrofolate cyclohydrolase